MRNSPAVNRIVFDEVFVPHEHVFMGGESAYASFRLTLARTEKHVCRGSSARVPWLGICWRACKSGP
jgi:hypothetical protein